MTASILVVDDNKGTRDLLARWLERSSYQATCVTSGHEALAAIAAGPFDLVLLDVTMPDVSGFEVLETVRLTQSAHALPIIMVTGNSGSRDIVSALDRGANDYVTKPIDMPVLLARIRALLSRRQSADIESELRERTTLSLLGSNDGVWEWRLDNDRFYFSSRWKNILGYRDDELPDTRASWFDRIHPHDRALVEADIDAHLDGETDYFANEHRVRTRAGTFKWVLSRGVAMANGSGRPRRIIGSLTDISDSKLADALTGFPNRMLFLDRLGRMLEHRKRHDAGHFAVLFLDLDHFKLVNDALGHAVGDELLIQAAGRLERCLRSTDTIARLNGSRSDAALPTDTSTVARLGGDEFAILLDSVHDDADVAQVAERIQRAFDRPFEVAGRPLFATASIGIATSFGDYADPGEILRDADTAMYRAKAAGRGRWEFFESSMREATMARLHLATDLRGALERGEFCLHYQPIVSLTAGLQITGMEALIRWQHPQRGLVPPDMFVSFAEESGLIVPIGFWALRSACQQLARWRAASPLIHAIVMSVNVSPRQLALPDLAERMISIVRASGVPLQNVELEVTESSVMTDASLAERTLGALKAAGFRLAIDDFGTGHSSLSYLQVFPVDRIKIDHSFVHRSQASDESQRIVSTVVNLAHALNLQVVAEGVSSQDVLDQMRMLGCDFGQGMLFSHAVPPKEATALLMNARFGLVDDRQRIGLCVPSIGSVRSDGTS